MNTRIIHMAVCSTARHLPGFVLASLRRTCIAHLEVSSFKQETGLTGCAAAEEGVSGRGR